MKSTETTESLSWSRHADGVQTNLYVGGEFAGCSFTEWNRLDPDVKVRFAAEVKAARDKRIEAKPAPRAATVVPKP